MHCIAQSTKTLGSISFRTCLTGFQENDIITQRRLIHTITQSTNTLLHNTPYGVSLASL